MEVFVRNVPLRATESDFSKFMRPILSNLNIHDWQCQKRKQKTFASLTFLDAKDAERFLALYGQAGFTGLSLAAKKATLMYLGVPLLFSLSKKQPDSLALKCLEMEKKSRLAAKQSATTSSSDDQMKNESNSLKVVSFACGLWAFRDSRPVFRPCFTHAFRGTIKFGSRMATASFETGVRLDFWFSTVIEINLESLPHPAITMTLIQAPNFLRTTSVTGNKTNWTRISCLDGMHETIAGTCLVYRFRLYPVSIDDQRTALGRAHGVPRPTRHPVEVASPTRSYSVETNTFMQGMEAQSRTRHPAALPFTVKFQLQKLVQNAYFSPADACELLPVVDDIITRAGSRICARAIRRLCHQLPYRCLETDVNAADMTAIITRLQSNAERLEDGEDFGYGAPSLQDRAYIHRVNFTPAGMYLYGPEPESYNRVLRKYRQNHEYFARVTFYDENGEPIRFSPLWSNDVIYHERIKGILNEGFSVAGRRFNFLGFSHSSLRAQSCWFMAPFVHEGSLLFDRNLIQGLGDFSKIRCPAKCAARIGQAFSETPVALTVEEGVARVVPDVERNGRVFSDGVGSLSRDLLEELWALLPPERRGKPRAFQIRYSGAKGMVALDARLPGEQMLIRSSMIKFPGLGSLDIEICEAAYKPLPYFLNQQTIKILEDMGVDDDFFFFHQKRHVDRLRLVTSSSSRASKFLKSHSIGDGIHLPWFIKQLAAMNLSFSQDSFLRNIIEMAVLAELRALKYKSRILVKEGYTLHGIMDETGVLEEGQIFCIVDEGGSPEVIAGKNLVISRSPALHPGDVRTVTGVRVPAESPLMQLRNCICFSSKGDRDLPSQLSGGDLDGDLYQILFDPQARPKRVFAPADYPRPEPVDLGRAIERQDMTDFFVTFMATDQLGRIANLHKVLADQQADGVLNSDCVTLAELHSTAVVKPYRPDFMVTGPHAVIQKNKPLSLMAESYAERDAEEDSPKYQFYESDKVLGRLFRAIDERKILASLQNDPAAMLSRPGGGAQSVLGSVWNHIQSQCQEIGLQLPNWQRHVSRARGVRDEYDAIVHEYAAEYGPTFSQPLSEYEVFMGTIIGKTGAQSKRQHENSVSMKDSFRNDMRYIVNRILGIDDFDDDFNFNAGLERCLACFAIGMESSSAFENDIPLQERKEPRPRYESLSSQELSYNGTVPGLQKSITTARKAHTGGKRVIFISLTLIVVPMLGLAALLLALVLVNNVDKPGEGTSSGNLTLDLTSQFQSSAYYVDFNPTTLVTIASWSSTVAPLLAVVAMVLVSFPLAQSFKKDSQLSGSELPTPYQFSLLLESFSAGITPLWNSLSYWRWPHREGRMASNVRNALTILAIFTTLGYTIAGVDTWLHLVMEAVNIELADPQLPQQALGRGLPDGPCSNQTAANFDGRDCIINIAATNIFLVNANEAARVTSNTSTTNAVYDMYIDDKHFSYLGPASNPQSLDYRAETLAVHTDCRQIGKQCKLGVGQFGASEPFHCTDALYGNLAQPSINGDASLTLAARAAGIVFYRDAGLTQLANKSSDGDSFLTRPGNPHHLAAWARVSLAATTEQTADGNVVTPTHGGTTWLLNCSATAYQVTYDFINGSVLHATAEVANGSVGTILNAPNYYGFGGVALETAATAASQYNDTAQMADFWAKAYSQSTMALASGIMTARSDLQEQTRRTKLVSRVPKAPLYALVALNALYAVLGIILAWIALGSNPSETNELREKLSTAGLVAACFERQRAERAVDKKRQMFAEYEGVSSGRVGVEDSAYEGGYVFRLRQGLGGGVP
ncbi:hypothetical protein H2200_008781 [Cladophialophora chaetospira]|uniref:RNA-directed RNA polymerase n=1 Tax=Cladophialophora chaetospira TaxID=386627 RepID=A0AA39CG17_9EURO|nr:hypothetical protein H2200_008781 [Cladophialophora chaetospira]